MEARINKGRFVLRTVIFAGVIGAAILFIWFGSWLANGGLPASGPTGNTMPPHTLTVQPADGETVQDPFGFCIDFNYQAGKGMGYDPMKSVRVFMDGIDVTKEFHGLITLNYPPSGGVFCYKTNTPLSAKWHTAKVIYSDISNTRFQYTWRFLVKTE